MTSAACEALGVEEEPIRISYLQSDLHHLPLWVALDKGFFDEAGVTVEVAGIFRAGPETMSAFAAGSLDIAYVGQAPATTAVANGAVRVTVLAQVNTAGSAVVVNSRSTIRNLADLAGKTVAIPGHSTVQELVLRKALKQGDLPLSKLGIIVLKPPEMIGALITGQINAFVAWEPFPAKAVTEKQGRVLVASSAVWPDHPCCVVVADNGFLRKHRDKAVAVVKAHVRAIEFIRNNNEEAARIAAKYTGMDMETIRLAMQNVAYTSKLSIAGEREYVTFLREMKLISVDDPDRFTRDFIDGTILEQVSAK